MARRLVLLSLVILFSCFVSGQHEGGEPRPQCPLSLVNSEWFVEEPAISEDANCQTGNPSCCDSSYYTLISSNSDPFALSLNQLDQPVPSPCFEKMKSLSCGVCSPESRHFVSNHETGADARVRVCVSFCDALLSSCSGATIDGFPVSDRYNGDGDRFCYELFKEMGSNISVFPLPDETAPLHCFTEEKPLCTKDDFDGYYSECNSSRNTRSYFERLKDDANCHGGYEPQKAFGLPCDQHCLGGTYLPPGSSSCERCEAGTYSVGGGHFFDVWKEFPPEIEWDTYCEDTDGRNINSGVKVEGTDCIGWIPDDLFLNSSAVLADSQNSVLEARVRILFNGSVTFTFRMQAEPLFDGLQFRVDGDSKMTYYANSPQFITRTFDLEPGIHVLKWIFFKDYSYSTGTDMAYIRSIRIIGTRLADSACDPCPLGYFSQAGAFECDPCPLNHFSDNPKTSECQKCPDNEYSYGLWGPCQPKELCTERDFSETYSKCQDNLRTKTYVPNQPQICDDSQFAFPDDHETQVECERCNPGQFRPPEGESLCTPCPTGMFSETGAETECEPCGPGTMAEKRVFYTRFNDYAEMPEVTTSCTGDCATAGFRLLGNSMDSGVGHGSLVDVYLDIKFTLERDGYISFYMIPSCDQPCRFQLLDVNNSRVNGTFDIVRQNQSNVRYFLRANLVEGYHHVQVIFSRYLAQVGPTSRTNRLIIPSFNISGVDSGGASECKPCDPGSFSEGSASVCELCPSGMYNDDEGTRECFKCPDRTFAQEKGSVECIECGLGTESLEDGSDCNFEECAYSPAENVEYNLSELKSTSKMYGPVWDVLGHGFYLNPCRRDHENQPCFDSSGAPIYSHGCQVTPEGFPDYDLGKIMGYLPRGDDLRSGIIMTFKGGSLGCAERDIYGNITVPPFPRETNITFICDPGAGIGYPVPVEPVEVEKCKYQFSWPSLYACPLCTIEDFTPVLGKCVNSLAESTYVPKEYPNKCHDGYIPLTEQVSCNVSSVSCPAGTYFPADAPEGSTKCEPTQPGFFSIGGGDFIDIFESYESLPYYFDRNGLWEPLGEVIRSDAGTSKFSASVSLVQSGYVSFRYKIVQNSANNDLQGGFFFGVDGSYLIPGNRSTVFAYKTETFHLEAGGHILSWEFVGGVLPSQDGRGFYAVIDKIIITGTEYAARQPTRCREGWYQPDAEQFECLQCLANSKSASGQANCTQCLDQEYSLPGSSLCQLKSRCELENDYSVQYTRCFHGKRTRSYAALLPKVCYDNNTEFPGNDLTFDCPSCPSGFVYEEDEEGYGSCSKCPLGFYEKKGSCKEIAAGKTNNVQISYFQKDKLPVGPGGPGRWPQDFRISCNGRCGTNGWRIVGDAVDSGFHSVRSEVDSLMTLEVEMIHEGSISFEFVLSSRLQEGVGSSNSSNVFAGLQFFIDGDEKKFMYHPDEGKIQKVQESSIPVGSHLFRWVFHQPLGTNRQTKATVSNIIVTGSKEGSTKAPVSCPRGYVSEKGAESCVACSPGFSAHGGDSACSKCEGNTYTTNYGEPECLSCGQNIKTNSNHTKCKLNGCVFTHPETRREYNVAPLNHVVSVYGGGSIYKISLCDVLDPFEYRCFDENNRPIDDSFVCTYNKGNGVGTSSGRVVNLLFKGESLTLQYTHGDRCGSSGPRETEVVFRCSVDDYQQFTRPFLTETNPCHLKVEWLHISACPVCRETSEDYKEQVGECEDGSQPVRWIRTGFCNGPEVIDQPERTCTRVFSLGLPWAVIAGSFLVILVVGVIVILIRNKKLADRYDTLVNRSNIKEDTPAPPKFDEKLEED